MSLIPATAIEKEEKKRGSSIFRRIGRGKEKKEYFSSQREKKEGPTFYLYGEKEKKEVAYPP